MRMQKKVKKGETDSLGYRLWLYGLPQYMVSSIYYCLELLHACILNFHGDVGVIQGKNVQTLVISVDNINDMLCILPHEMEVERFTRKKIEDYRSSRKDHLKFCNVELKKDVTEFPKFSLSIKSFNQDLWDIFSMLAFIFCFNTDKDVHEFKLALAFKLKKQMDPFYFDFVEIIQKIMLKDFESCESQLKFGYLYLLAHMFTKTWTSLASI